MSNIQKQHKISPAIAWLTIQKFIIFYCPLDGEHTTLLRASFFLSTWTCYFFSPTGIIAYADQEINMQVILKHSETNKKLLFTHHCPARCFGMNMPKSRDIQAKIPLPQANWNEFWLCYCERSEQ